MKKIILGIVFLFSVFFASGQNGVVVMKDGISLEHTIALNDGKIQLYKSPFYSDVLLWLGDYDGNDLVNEVGVNIPYVSGTGLDAIYDFSVLNDSRFDKGSYIGNSFGLPEYYNFPYVNIYYDPTSAATRKYWKLTDFHYANFLDQSLTVDNIAFLKAKATTNTSNVIASVQSLLIYSVAQTGDNLTQLKNYIGIQDDFEINLIINGEDWYDDNEDGVPNNWAINRAAILSKINGIIKAEPGLTFYGLTADTILQPNIACVCDVIVRYRVRINTGGQFRVNVGTGTFIVGDGSFHEYEHNEVLTGEFVRAQHSDADGFFELDYLRVIRQYINYYKS